ncbi:MAG TPA: hypothetical protein VNO19_11415 [Gemmatimonadales bacterium]|nr:hypothetical protein [Gemmatimonadales bacterium]
MRGEAGGGMLGFLAAALASAVLTGLTGITATVLIADALRSRNGAANVELRFYLIAGGTIAGLVLAAFVAWRLLEPIASTYRRGGLAMVAAFATVVLMLVCTGVFQLFGRAGLLSLLGFSAVTSTLLAFQARRLKPEVQL